MNKKQIIKLVLDDIANIYLYILIFYVVSLALSIFFESWRLFFYWPAFHGVVMILGILALASEKGREFIKSIKSKVHKVHKVYQVHQVRKVYQVYEVESPKSIKSKESKVHQVHQVESQKSIKSIKSIKSKAKVDFDLLRLLAAAKNDLLEIKMKAMEIILKICGKIILKMVYKTAEIAKAAAFLFFLVAGHALGIFINLLALKIKRLKKTDYLKIAILMAAVYYALSNKLNVVDFSILIYAATSVLFILDSRISAGIALIFLASTPFYLVEKKDVAAETMAIYAYYFLVIAVLTQIRELGKEEGEVHKVHKVQSPSSP